MSTSRLLAIISPIALSLSLTAFAESYPDKPASVAYVKTMKARIGPLWAGYAKQKPRSVSRGTVTISFRINPDGTVQDIRVNSNTSNQFLADISIRTIKNVKLPPLPAAVLREQGRNWVEVTNMHFDAP